MQKLQTGANLAYLIVFCNFAKCSKRGVFIYIFNQLSPRNCYITNFQNYCYNQVFFEFSGVIIAHNLGYLHGDDPTMTHMNVKTWVGIASFFLPSESLKLSIQTSLCSLRRSIYILYTFVFLFSM